MAPLPVIENVYRIVLEWTSTQGISPVNVIHVRAESPTTATDIAVSVEAALTAAMFAPVSSTSSLDHIMVTPLNGVSSTFSHQVVPSIAGGASGQTVLNLSALLNFGTIQRGARGRGRIFLGPTTEDVNSGGNAWDSGSRGALVIAWQAFQDALQANSPELTHVVASYVHADANEVLTWEADQWLRSTKSRLNQKTR